MPTDVPKVEDQQSWRAVWNSGAGNEQTFADPSASATTTQDIADRKARFAKDIDAAQMLPSVITVVGVAVTVSPELGRTLTAVTITVALLTYASLQAWISRKTPAEYTHLSGRLPANLSPVNTGVIVVYVVLAGVVVISKR